MTQQFLLRNKFYKIQFTYTEDMMLLVTCQEKRLKGKIAKGSATWWNFHGRTVNSVYEMREDWIECFSSIINEPDQDNPSISEASGLKRWLNDPTFLFFLDLFHQIFPHVELLFQFFKQEVRVSFWLERQLGHALKPFIALEKASMSSAKNINLTPGLLPTVLRQKKLAI